MLAKNNEPDQSLLNSDYILAQTKIMSASLLKIRENINNYFIKLMSINFNANQKSKPATIEECVLDSFDEIEKVNHMILLQYATNLMDDFRLIKSPVSLEFDKYEVNQASLSKFIDKLNCLNSIINENQEFLSIEDVIAYLKNINNCIHLLREYSILVVKLKYFISYHDVRLIPEQNFLSIKDSILQIDNEAHDLIQIILKQLSNLEKIMADFLEKRLSVNIKTIKGNKKLSDIYHSFFKDFYAHYYLSLTKNTILPDYKKEIENIIKKAEHNVFISYNTGLVKFIKNSIERILKTIHIISEKITYFKNQNYIFPESWDNQVEESYLLMDELRSALTAMLDQLKEAFKDRMDDYDQLWAALSDKLEKAKSSSQLKRNLVSNLMMGVTPYHDNKNNIANDPEIYSSFLNEEEDINFGQKECDLLAQLLTNSKKRDGDGVTQLIESRSGYLNYIYEKLILLDKDQTLLEETQYKYMLLVSDDHPSNIDVHREVNALEDLNSYEKLYGYIENSLNENIIFKTMPLTEKDVQIKENCSKLVADLKKRAGDLRRKINTIFGSQLYEAKEAIKNNNFASEVYSFEEDIISLQKLLDNLDITLHDKTNLFKLNESLSIRLDLIKREELYSPTESEQKKFNDTKNLITLIQDKIKNELKKVN